MSLEEDINVLTAGFGWVKGPMFGGIRATYDYEGKDHIFICF
jgi:hypothetical protein